VEVVNRLTCMSRKKATGGWYDTRGAVTQHDSDCTGRVVVANDDDGDGG
jgi:hypothetical protein